MVIHFHELLQYYQGIFAYLHVSRTIRLEPMEAALTYIPEILKKEATIALPRHDGENPKNTFSPFVLVLIIVLHSVSLGKLSLSQDLHYIKLIT